MARGRDPLEEQKIGTDGEGVTAKSNKELANRLIGDAHAELPKGVPDNSPYVAADRDHLISEAARMSIPHSAIMLIEDLRLVCEHGRMKIARAGAPEQRAPQPPVPEQRVAAVKIRGLKDSPTNTWRVLEHRKPEDTPNISFGNGQMSKLGNGAVLELRHYDKRILQSIVDQGVKLVPIEEVEED